MQRNSLPYQGFPMSAVKSRSVKSSDAIPQFPKEFLTKRMTQAVPVEWLVLREIQMAGVEPVYTAFEKAIFQMVL